MKKSQLVILICFFTFKLFSQSASQSHFFIDSINNKWSQVEYGKEIKVYTKDSIFKGELDSVSNNIIFLNEKVIKLGNINEIKFKNRAKIHSISSFLALSIGSFAIFGFACIISFITIGLLWYNSGFIFYIAAFISIYSLLFLLILVPTIFALLYLLLMNNIIWKSIKFKK